jgi:hypothetical protein
VASQVRRRFESSVHLQDGIPSSGFYMVATFSDFNFPLNEENVSLALESCIGGYADRLQVVWLYDRNFRFRVASNRVGQFIHALEFFKCADFTCSFNLFHGKVTRNSLLAEIDGSWNVPGKFKSHHPPSYLRNFPIHLKGKLDGEASRSYAIKPDLSILHRNAKEVSFHSDHGVDLGVLNNIKIGGFSFSESACRDSISTSVPLQFGCGAVRKPLSFHTDYSLDSINDLITAGYTPSGIVSYIQLFKFACIRCLSMGHKSSKCVNQFRCLGCLQLGHMKKDCPTVRHKVWKPKVSKQIENTTTDVEPISSLSLTAVIPPKISLRSQQIWVKKASHLVCVRCLRVGHLSLVCYSTPRCQYCWRYGHSVTGCKTKK